MCTQKFLFYCEKTFWQKFDLGKLPMLNNSENSQSISTNKVLKENLLLQLTFWGTKKKSQKIRNFHKKKFLWHKLFLICFLPTCMFDYNKRSLKWKICGRWWTMIKKKPSVGRKPCPKCYESRDFEFFGNFFIFEIMNIKRHFRRKTDWSSKSRTSWSFHRNLVSTRIDVA